jgi:WD40 repeat protein
MYDIILLFLGYIQRMTLLIRMQKYKELNSINSLWTMRSNPHGLVSGARDGSVHVWDSRAGPSSGPQIEWYAHEAKLNIVQCSGDDRTLISSGRDDSVRLWDLRNVVAPIQSYSQHKVCLSCFPLERNVCRRISAEISH